MLGHRDDAEARGLGGLGDLRNGLLGQELGDEGMDHEGKTEGVLHGCRFLCGGSVMRGVTLSRGSAPHPTRFGQEARARVLERIRRALAEGDDVGALRIAQELERRFDEASRPLARRQG
jgi:hypothetical protein